MVNKGSFFQRLKERWGSGSGVRVETRSTGAHNAANARGAGIPNGANGRGPTPIAPRAAKPAEPPPVAARVEPEREPAPPPLRELATEFAAADVRTTRKLTEREEAMLAVGAHFQELTALLRSSQARTDDQLQKLVVAASALGSLPGLSQQQLELLRGMSAHFERQNALGERLASTLSTLPNLLQNVETALARAAATDERTAQTVREFQSTMDRIHASMGRMVEHSDQQAKATQLLAERRDGSFQEITKTLEVQARSLEASQQQAVKELQRAHDESLSSLRRTHEDQSNRLQRIVQESTGWNRALLAGIALVVLGIGGLIVLQLVK